MLGKVYRWTGNAESQRAYSFGSVRNIVQGLATLRDRQNRPTAPKPVNCGLTCGARLHDSVPIRYQLRVVFSGTIMLSTRLSAPNPCTMPLPTSSALFKVLLSQGLSLQSRSLRSIHGPTTG